jgi:S-DNA-T family DNA segregation ATPase FtsK/SpoIIIE
MPRKKKKQKITIQSTETKILFGVIIFILGLAVLLTPFVKEESAIFDPISLFLGYSSIAWGVLIIYLSLFLLTKKRKFISSKQAIGVGFFSTALSILLSFWLVEEQLANSDSLRSAGGTLGKSLHLGLNGFVGDFLELIIILFVLIVAFSLITGTTLEQIRDFLESSVGEGEGAKLDLKDLLQSREKLSSKKHKEEEVTIVGGDEPIMDEAEAGEELPQQEEIQFVQEAPVAPTYNEREPSANETGEAKTDDDLQPQEPKYTDWVFPDLNLLQDPQKTEQDKELYKQKGHIIEQTLKSFGIQTKVVQISIGPTVLRFALSITVGTKVSKIKNLSNDLALALASHSSSVRIEAPIPGTSYVGIEIPNPTPNFVYTKELVARLKRDKDKYELPIILGKDITGKIAIKDLAKIPHLLVAGATGTGKSVGINSLITGILMTKTPDEVKFIMIDPKMGVEMASYNGIPHLLNPVITDMELVVNALQWTIDEMMRRYRLLKQVHAKKLTEYNKKIGYTAMPYIVIVIDEMADLMLTAGADVETKIQRLAQMGRAVGVHLVLATQKPTVNVITGLIKSNIPGRMAFAVATAMDSRVILDESGAETLIGNGDMLYKDQTSPKALRIQGTYTSTEDSENVIKAIKEQITEEDVEYSEDLQEAIEKGPQQEGGAGGNGDRDPQFGEALEIAVLNQKVSASFLQRKMRIGYNKAARLIDELQAAGAIGPQNGSKPREVLVTSVEQILEQSSE